MLRIKRTSARQLLVGVLAITLVAGVTHALADTDDASGARTWKDATGKFEVTAEFVAVEGDNVRLRNSNGKEIVVPLKKLSRADRAYLKGLKNSEMNAEQSGSDAPVSDEPDGEEPDGDVPAEDNPAKLLPKLAEKFYADLRTETREVATEMLTAQAQKAASEGASPLAPLPKPDERSRSIRPGKVEVENDEASIAVRVRVAGKQAKTKLHFRMEEAEWRVFAISAQLPDGEKTINFEMASAAPAERVDPLQALVGKPMPLTGLMPGGKPFDIAQLKGKVVLVDFWATWCGPCKAEMPNIAANYEKYHDKGFEVVAVSVDKNMDALGEFITKQQTPWIVLADRHPKNRQSMASQYGISGIPALALVGPDGKVVEVHCRGERLGKALERLLGKPSEKQVASK